MSNATLKHKLVQAAAIAFAGLLALSACSSSDPAPSADSGTEKDSDSAPTAVEYPHTFTDMNGREVTIEEPAKLAFGAGAPGTQVIYTFDQELMVGWNRPIDDAMLPYVSEDAADLPVLGMAFGDSGDFNAETLLATGVDVIIDAGDMSPKYAESADELAEQTGIPVVQVATDPMTMDETYRILGEVFGQPERAAELSEAAAAIVEEVEKGAATIKDEDRVTGYFGRNDDSLSTAGSGSIHSRVLDLVGIENVAGEAEKTSGHVEIDAEQLLAWNPDWVLVVPGWGGNDPKTDPNLTQLTAVKEGRLLVSPTDPYPWLDGPPSLNQLIGLVWVAEAVYPDAYDFDVPSEVKDFYEVFYHTTLTDDQVDKMLADSGFPAAS